jgi:hypothetical protein
VSVPSNLANLLRRAAEIRRERADYYRHRISLYGELAEEGREKLGRLIDGAAGNLGRP